MLFNVAVAFAEDNIEFRSVSLGTEDSVTDLSQHGRHYDALNKYLSLDRDAEISEKLACAQSSWALGLVNRARDFWQELLVNPDIKEEQRFQISLSEAILEMQEGNFDVARSIAEQNVNKLPPSELRAQFWMIIAEALREQKVYSLAESYYKKAIEEGSDKIRSEANYQLGVNQMSIGLVNDARYSFVTVPINSEYAAKALRKLVEVDLIQKNYDGVLNWIAEGRKNFRSEFTDSWISYAALTAQLENDKFEDAKREIQQMRLNNTSNNIWLTLAEAAYEAKAVKSFVAK